jgi:COP9 signalosome complex subunit 5
MKSEPAAAALKDDGSAPALKQMADFRYHFDAKKLEDLRSEAPWKNDAKFFRKVAVSPSAVMKMVRADHCWERTLIAEEMG